MTDSDKELYHLFFQRSSMDYIDKVDDFEEYEKRVSFNPYIFALGIFWFAYRKMYVEIGTIIILLIAFNEMFGSLVGGILSLVLMLSLSFIGNYLYITKAQRVVEKSKSKYSLYEKREAYLKKKGGTSFILPIIIILFISIYYFIIINGIHDIEDFCDQIVYIYSDWFEEY